MIKIKVFKNGKEYTNMEGVIGESLMNVCKRYKITEIKGICGGTLSCASCHILIKSHHNILLPVSEEEEDMLYSLAEPFPLKNSRLSCQIILNNDLNNLEIEII